MTVQAFRHIGQDLIRESLATLAKKNGDEQQEASELSLTCSLKRQQDGEAFFQITLRAEIQTPNSVHWRAFSWKK